MDANANEPYLASGRNGGAMLLPFVGLASASVAAFVYTTVVMNLPLVGYFTALLVVAFAFLTAFPLAVAGQVLRVRSESTMRLYGVTTGIVAVYLAWVFFAWRFASDFLPPPSPSLWEWFQSPAALWDFARSLAETGWYTIGGISPRGAVIWLLWAVEAGIVIGACVHWAPSRIEGRAFCETCRRWMQPEHWLPLASTSMIAKHVRRDGLASIQDVALPTIGTDHWAWLRSWRCESCAAGVLRIDRVMATVTNDLLSPTWTPRATAHCEAILPLSWQRPDDAAHLQRIAETLRTANLG